MMYLSRWAGLMSDAQTRRSAGAAVFFCCSKTKELREDTCWLSQNQAGPGALSDFNIFNPVIINHRDTFWANATEIVCALAHDPSISVDESEDGKVVHTSRRLRSGLDCVSKCQSSQEL